MIPVKDTLSAVSGIPVPEINKIWEQVKANHRRLKECPGPHDFAIETRKIGALVTDYRCTICQGEVSSIHRSWYLTGFAHGKK